MSNESIKVLKLIHWSSSSLPSLDPDPGSTERQSWSLIATVDRRLQKTSAAFDSRFRVRHLVIANIASVNEWAVTGFSSW